MTVGAGLYLGEDGIGGYHVMHTYQENAAQSRN